MCRFLPAGGNLKNIGGFSGLSFKRTWDGNTCEFQNGTFFIAGGYNGKDCLSDVYLLNGIDNLFSISRLKPLPSQLKNAAALSTLSQGNEPQILIIGGWDESRTLRSIFQYTIYEVGCLLSGTNWWLPG